jgi:hypothetical protein
VNQVLNTQPKARRSLAPANQRPSNPMSAPALVRHLLFRIPGDLNPRYCAHNNDRAYMWAALLFRINACIAAYQAVFRSEPTPRFWIRLLNRAGPRPDEYYASDTAFFDLGGGELDWCRVRLQVNIFLESFSLTLTIDRIDSKSPLSELLESLAEAPTAEMINKVFGAFAPGGEIVDLDVSKVLSAAIPEQDERLRQVCGELDEAQLVNLRRARIRFGGETHQLAKPFAEFRGLVLSAKSDEAFIELGREAFAELRPTKSLTPNLAEFLTSRGELVRQFVGANWQPPQGAAADANATGLLSAESVVCGMLDGAALYASPLSMGSAYRDRVNFLAVYDGNSEAQLGRFIRRLLVMGELRLSALMDLDGPQRPTTEDSHPPARHLVEAGQTIRRIGIELRKVEVDPADADLKALSDILDTYRKLNDSSPDGLIFRIERSRYYSEAFKTRIQDLRIVRLEGWQPYDEFVRRYLYQLYDLISSIGVRYEALGRRVDRLQSFRIGEAIAKQTEAASKLQRRGEDIAIIAGLYYGYHVLLEAPAANEFIYRAGEVFVFGTLTLVVVDVLVSGRLIRNWLIYGLKWVRRRLVKRLREHLPRVLFLWHPPEEAEGVPKEGIYSRERMLKSRVNERGKYVRSVAGRRTQVDPVAQTASSTAAPEPEAPETPQSQGADRSRDSISS